MSIHTRKRVIMKQISKIKYFVFAFLMSFTLIASAEYTVKVFIDGLSVNSAVNPVPETDGDPTEQTGGDSEFTFKVSRTTGYNHNSFIFIAESNYHNCFRIINEATFGPTPYEYCDIEQYPYEVTLETHDAAPGIYNFQVETMAAYEGVSIKTYNFTIEILAVDPDPKSDSDLTFGYHKKVITQGEQFTVSVNSSTFECYKLNILNDNYGAYDTICRDNGFPSISLVNLEWDFPDFVGVLQLEIEGYNLDVNGINEIDNKKYPFSVTVNESTADPLLSDFKMEFNQPIEYNTFNSPVYGRSKYYQNNLMIFASKTSEVKADINSLGYTTGWKSINYAFGGNEIPLEIEAPADGFYEVTVSARHNGKVVSQNKTLYVAGNQIKDFELDFCSYSAVNCGDYIDSLAIRAGNGGTSGSITFMASNTDCISVQSNDDPNYNTAVEKCWGNGGADVYAVFDMEFPDHDPTNLTPKDYTYNFKAINWGTGEEYTETFTVNIYYD